MTMAVTNIVSRLMLKKMTVTRNMTMMTVEIQTDIIMLKVMNNEDDDGENDAGKDIDSGDKDEMGMKIRMRRSEMRHNPTIEENDNYTLAAKRQ